MFKEDKSLISGAAGAIEIAVSVPNAAIPAAGLVVIGHPHPLFGGSMDNKVITTLTRAFADWGLATVRFNFRGVGKSAGVHDDGLGETADFLTVSDQVRERLGHSAEAPLIFAGFSFGGAVALAASQARAVARLLVVAPAFSRVGVWRNAELPGDDAANHAALAAISLPAATLVLHGLKDETVAFASSEQFAELHDCPIYAVAGAEHFFHGKLHHVKRAVGVLLSL